MKRRYTAALLALAIALALLPVSGEEDASLGRMEAITGESTIETSGRTITVTPKVLQWSEANKEVGRDISSWWVGVNIVSPPMTKTEAESTTFTRNGSNDPVFFKDKWDSPKPPPDTATEYRMGAWGSLNPLFITYYHLENQLSVDYTWIFTWKGTDPVVD